MVSEVSQKVQSSLAHTQLKVVMNMRISTSRMKGQSDIRTRFPINCRRQDTTRHIQQRMEDFRSAIRSFLIGKQNVQISLILIIYMPLSQIAYCACYQRDKNIQQLVEGLRIETSK